MTTDPFANPNPRPNQPVPPPPPPGGFNPGWQPSAPTGLMWSTIALAGGGTLISLASTLTTSRESIAASYEAEAGAAPGQTLLGLFSLLLFVASYITLALWMTAVHKNLTSRGVAQPLHFIWAWFAWIVPLANYVLPAMYMNGLNKRTRSWALWPWWLSWCAYWTVSIGAGFYVFGVTFGAASAGATTIELTDAQLSTVINLGYLGTAFFVASFVFLAKLLKDITDTHLVNEA